MNRGQFIYDLLERAAKTFVQAYLGVWLIVYNADSDQAFQWENVRVGLVAGAVALATSFVGKGIGNSESGSWLPADKDPGN